MEVRLDSCRDTLKVNDVEEHGMLWQAPCMFE
ncbi:hypothetical protein LINPERPRIM_LOCUS42640 [Linum perenne]